MLICSLIQRSLLNSTRILTQAQAFKGIGNKSIACCFKIFISMTNKDKEVIKTAQLNLEMIYKNVFNAINNGLNVEYSVEPNTDGTFIIMVTATDLRNTP